MDCSNYFIGGDIHKSYMYIYTVITAGISIHFFFRFFNMRGFESICHSTYSTPRLSIAAKLGGTILASQKKRGIQRAAC